MDDMKLKFSHFHLNGLSGSASAFMPGPRTESNLDRPSDFQIQAGFIVLPRGTTTTFPSDTAAQIPGKESIVHIHFNWEQAIHGSVVEDDLKWPSNGQYRMAFASMLANMLAQSEIEIPFP
jgi:hypothetical protein